MTTPAKTRSAYWRACRDRSVWLRAAKLGFVVGVIQVALNQGDHWLRHEVNALIVIKSILSPLLSFAIAFASSVSTHAQNLESSVSVS
jgi:hypothetical protein